MNEDLKQQVIDYSLKLNSTNLSPLRSGNLSVRAKIDEDEGFYITPSGIKYEKLKKLQKSFQNKYKVGYFSEENVQSKIDEHNLKIKEKGQRYINKNLQKCGLK